MEVRNHHYAFFFLPITGGLFNNLLGEYRLALYLIINSENIPAQNVLFIYPVNGHESVFQSTLTLLSGK